MKKVSLFSTNVWIFHVKEWKDVKDEILSLIPDINKTPSNNPADLTKDLVFYTDYFDFDTPELSEYRNKFLDLVSPYIREFAKNTPKKKIKDIKNIWCQKYGAGDYHPPHDHGPTGYSAVFFASVVDEKKDGTHFFSNHWDEYGERTELKAPAAEGNLIFFPSYLMHSSTVHHSDEKRIIISMNLGV